MYYWSFFPFCRSLYILIMKYLTYTKLSGFDQTSVYWKHVIFLLVSFDLKSLKNSWYIWQYISGWRFLHKLKILRLVLGSVYLQRFKSSTIFYKPSISLITLDFFPLFDFKKVKMYRTFLFRINIYVFEIYTECCPIICPMLCTFQLPPIYFPPFLHSRVTSLQYFLFCSRKVRYVFPTLLPGIAFNLWKKRSPRYSPHPLPHPPLPKKEGAFILYNNIFPNILCKMSIYSGIFRDLLTKI